MRYTPSLPPVSGLPEEAAPLPPKAVRAVTPVARRVQPVQEAMNLVKKEGRSHSADKARAVDLPEPAAAPALRAEVARRQYFRRLVAAHPLMDTRSGEERRKKNRRDDDPIVAVDADA